MNKNRSSVIENIHQIDRFLSIDFANTRDRLNKQMFVPIETTRDSHAWWINSSNGNGTVFPPQFIAETHLALHRSQQAITEPPHPPLRRNRIRRITRVRLLPFSSVVDIETMNSAPAFLNHRGSISTRFNWDQLPKHSAQDRWKKESEWAVRRRVVSAHEEQLVPVRTLSLSLSPYSSFSPWFSILFFSFPMHSSVLLCLSRICLLFLLRLYRASERIQFSSRSSFCRRFYADPR